MQLKIKILCGPQWVKLSYIKAPVLIPAASLQIQVSIYVPTKAVEDGSSIWTPDTHVGDSAVDQTFRFQHRLADVATWKLNPNLEDLFIYLSVFPTLSSAFQTKRN